MKRSANIVVLAGVNGAGKSSIGGMFARTHRDFFYNPDTVARRILDLHPDISQPLANGQAWEIGRALLEQAIATGKDYRFETTLGGRTIADLLRKAAEAGHRLHIWFCGLDSPEHHLRRVRSRVELGGHDIAEAKIRERWMTSRENLIRLMPHIHHLRVYDNSFDADPAKGQKPRPVLWLEMKKRRIVAPKDLSGAPVWVQPLIGAALRLGRTH